MSDKPDRSAREIELTEQLLAVKIEREERESRKVQVETDLAGYEVQEYERQERNAKSKHSEARIYNFVDQVTPQSVKSAIGTLTEWTRRGSDPIILIVNTPGGNVFSGLALFDAIKYIQKGDEEAGLPPITINTVARGMAASMGGIIFQAGNERRIEDNAYILIHEISDIAIGSTSELEDEVKLTKRLQKKLVNILAERSTLSTKQIDANWKRKDWWLDAEEAVAKGFADTIV